MITVLDLLVKKAARLAVYVDIMIRIKNQNAAASIRPDGDLGVLSPPCCRVLAVANHRLFIKLNSSPSPSLSAVFRYPRGLK
jgi:hypothetical protein